MCVKMNVLYIIRNGEWLPEYISFACKMLTALWNVQLQSQEIAYIMLFFFYKNIIKFLNVGNVDYGNKI